MKYSNLQAFEKHLEASAPKHFAPIYVILSKDRFTRKKTADHLSHCLLAKETHPELCLKIFNEDQINPIAILDELETMGLFAPRKVISIDIGEKTAHTVLKPIQDYFSRPSPSLFLIISAAAINHSTTFYKQAEKTGVILELPEEKEWEKEKSAIAWVASTVSSKGKTIEHVACQHLVKQVGTDTSMLHQELEKLLCYIGDRTQITLQDVGAICTSVNVENAWQLGDALFKRDVSTALRISKGLLNDGIPFLSLLRQVRHQIQTDYTVCSILANGGGTTDVMEKFPYMKGYILDRHVNAAKSYGMARFKKAMINIDSIETMAKNSITDYDLLAELLIVKLVG